MKTTPNKIQEDVWAADKLLKSRCKKGKLEYLVKWRGYGVKSASWEPAENILDKRLFEEFKATRLGPSRRRSTHLATDENANPSRSRRGATRTQNAGTRRARRALDRAKTSSKTVGGKRPRGRPIGSKSKRISSNELSYDSECTDPCTASPSRMEILLPDLPLDNTVPVDLRDSRVYVPPRILLATDGSRVLDSPQVICSGNVVFTDVTANDLTITIKEMVQ